MEALIPKLFIITAEASIVLFLLLVVMIIFNIKAKRKDINAVNELVSGYVNSKEERIALIKKQLQNIGYTGNKDEQAEQLYNQEKTLIKEFVTLYLRRDTYRLLEYPENIIEVDTNFLKTSGSSAEESTPAPMNPGAEASSEENANATILAREQVESNKAHLKELSELRLKNTELNEQLFEALETITALMTEHGKKTSQEVESNAQKILDAMLYLRDKRLDSNEPEKLAPSPDDGYDHVEDPWSVELAENNATLDDSTAVHLGISDELNADLETLDDEPEPQPDPDKETEHTENSAEEETAAINLDEPADEVDPWADALAEQASEETSPEPESEEDPWAAALAEQEKSEKK